MVNPHSWLYLDVKGADGNGHQLGLRVRHADLAAAQGLQPRTTSSVGTQVQVTGYPRQERRAVRLRDDRHPSRWPQGARSAARRMRRETSLTSSHDGRAGMRCSPSLTAGLMAAAPGRPSRDRRRRHPAPAERQARLLGRLADAERGRLRPRAAFRPPRRAAERGRGGGRDPCPTGPRPWRRSRATSPPGRRMIRGSSAGRWACRAASIIRRRSRSSSATAT